MKVSMAAYHPRNGSPACPGWWFRMELVYLALVKAGPDDCGDSEMQQGANPVAGWFERLRTPDTSFVACLWGCGSKD